MGCDADHDVASHAACIAICLCPSLLCLCVLCVGTSTFTFELRASGTRISLVEVSRDVCAAHAPMMPILEQHLRAEIEKENQKHA